MAKKFDFKKDPEILNACFNALVNLGQDGVLDLRKIGGKRWQLQEKFDRPDAPTIDIVEVTRLRFPSAEGNNGVFAVTMACATPGVVIKYKIDDGEEEEYTEPFDYSVTGEHTIRAWSVIGTTQSASDVSKKVNVSEVVATRVWGTIQSKSLTYSKASVSANGEAVSKSGMTIKQNRTVSYVNSNKAATNEVLDVTASAEITGWTNTDGSATDVLTIPANEKAAAKTFTPTAAFSVNGQTGSVSTTVTQAAASLSLSKSSESNIAAAGVSGKTFTITTAGIVTDIEVSADEGVTATLDGMTVTWSIGKNAFNTARTKKVYVAYKINGAAQTRKEFSIAQLAKVYEAYYGYIPSSITGFTSKATALLDDITDQMIAAAISQGTLVKASSLPITESAPKLVTTEGKFGYFLALVYEHDTRVVKQFDGLSAYVPFDDAPGYFSNGGIKRTTGGDTFKVFATYAATGGSEYQITIQ